MRCGAVLRSFQSGACIGLSSREEGSPLAGQVFPIGLSSQEEGSTRAGQMFPSGVRMWVWLPVWCKVKNHQREHVVPFLPHG